ncbi:MAG: hypothetical protein RL101_287 [Actinomycetota bacterium]|jgi:predicted transcriptional regulator
MAMTVRFTPKQDAKLQMIAAEHGISKQQALVLALDQYDERRERRKLINEAVQLVLTRDAELMKRLAEND